MTIGQLACSRQLFLTILFLTNLSTSSEAEHTIKDVEPADNATKTAGRPFFITGTIEWARLGDEDVDWLEVEISNSNDPLAYSYADSDAFIDSGGTLTKKWVKFRLHDQPIRQPIVNTPGTYTLTIRACTYDGNELRVHKEITQTLVIVEPDW